MNRDRKSSTLSALGHLAAMYRRYGSAVSIDDSLSKPRHIAKCVRVLAVEVVEAVGVGETTGRPGDAIDMIRAVVELAPK